MQITVTSLIYSILFVNDNNIRIDEPIKVSPACSTFIILAHNSARTAASESIIILLQIFIATARLSLSRSSILILWKPTLSSFVVFNILSFYNINISYGLDYCFRRILCFSYAIFQLSCLQHATAKPACRGRGSIHRDFCSISHFYLILDRRV